MLQPYVYFHIKLNRRYFQHIYQLAVVALGWTLATFYPGMFRGTAYRPVLALLPQIKCRKGH